MQTTRKPNLLSVTLAISEKRDAERQQFGEESQEPPRKIRYSSLPSFNHTLPSKGAP